MSVLTRRYEALNTELRTLNRKKRNLQDLLLLEIAERGHLLSIRGCVLDLRLQSVETKVLRHVARLESIHAMMSTDERKVIKKKIK